MRHLADRSHGRFRLSRSDGRRPPIPRLAIPHWVASVACLAGLTALVPNPAAAEKPTVLAQATPAPRPAPRVPMLTGQPGQAVPLVHDLVDMAASTGNYVIINRAPGWVSLSPAESIGSGVWLIGPEQLRSAHVNLSSSAKGRHELSIAVVGPGGKPIAEAKLMVDVTATATPATASAAPPGPAVLSVAAAQAAPSAPPQPAPRQPAAALVAPVAEPQAPAAKPVAAGSPAAAPALPAVPSAPTAVAQASPAKDGAKAWTEFLKPGGQAKQVPAPKPAQKPVAGGKSEAELIGYAKHLVRECTTCHSLYGQDVGIPLMIGLAKDRFLDTMELYRIGKRDNVAMQSVAQSLNEEDTLALALYLGRIKPPPQSATAARSGTSSSTSSSGLSEAALAATGLTIPEQPIAAGSKDLDRVERWLKRGKQMLDSGEISQARLLLTRATELGDPRAALMLATSYDPNALPWRPGTGPEAEPARAKALYQLAIKLGAGAEAERRLLDLP